MKKLLWILVIILLLPLGIFAQIKPAEDEAVNDKNMEEKVITLKKKLNITQEYEEFNMGELKFEQKVNQDNFLAKLSKGKSIYQYSWRDDKLGYLEAATDEKGNLLSYTKGSFNEENKGPKSLVKQEIMEDVEGFFNQLDPQLLKIFELEDFKAMIKEGIVSLTYVRKVNDIPFVQDKINIHYNLYKHEVEGFSRGSHMSFSLISLKDSEFDSPEKNLSMEKAQEIFKEQEPLTLYYFPLGKKALAVYTRKEFQNIDAMTGKLLPIYNLEGYYYGDDMVKEAGVSEDFKSSLTPVERKEIKNVKGLKSEAQVKKQAETFIPKGFILENISLSHQGEEYYYYLSYRLKKKEKYASITLNAKTLELENLALSRDSVEEETKLAEDQAIAIALDFVEKHVKDKKELDLKAAHVDPRDKNYVRIPRKVNGVEVLTHGLRIYIHPKDQKVYEFNRFMDKIDFPKLDGILSQEEAHKFFFDSSLFIKKYTLTKDRIALVYGLKDNGNYFLNAKTKKWIDGSGREMNLRTKIDVPNLEKSRYKKEIGELANMGIGLPGRELQEKLKYRDVYYLFQLLHGGEYFPTEEDLQFYIQNPNMEKTDKILDQEIPRHEMLKLLLHFHRYENLFKLEGIFREDLFTDENSFDESGKAMILAKGLGILKEDEARPKDIVTLEEALLYIYRSL